MALIADLFGFFSYCEAVTNLRNLDLDMVSRLCVGHEDHESLDARQAVTTSTYFFDVDFVLFSFLYRRVPHLITHLIFTSLNLGQSQQEEEHTGDRFSLETTLGSRSRQLP
jgi:hypothetical protein